MLEPHLALCAAAPAAALCTAAPVSAGTLFRAGTPTGTALVTVLVMALYRALDGALSEHWSLADFAPDAAIAPKRDSSVPLRSAAAGLLLLQQAPPPPPPPLPPLQLPLPLTRAWFFMYLMRHQRKERTASSQRAHA
jgi:hypothetical protein